MPSTDKTITQTKKSIKNEQILVDLIILCIQSHADIAISLNQRY